MTLKRSRSISSSAHLVAEAARHLERALGPPQQLAAVGQAGQCVEVRQVADLVLGDAPIGHVLDDAGVADHLPVLVELGLGLDVHDVVAAVPVGRDRDVGGQHRAVLERAAQHAHEHAPVLRRHHAQQAAHRQALAVRQPEHAQRLGREREPALSAPLEAAHAGEVLRAGQLGLAALELQPRARGAQQVTQAAVEQAPLLRPLLRLDEEVGRPRLVGARDRGVVVQAGEHQHRHMVAAGQGAQRAAGLEAVEAGHHRVEQDDVGQALGQRVQRALAAVGLAHDEAALAQRRCRDHQRHRIVVGQQHASRLVRLLVGAEQRDGRTHRRQGIRRRA